MPVAEIVKTTPIQRSDRVEQIETMFDLPRSDRFERRWTIDLPLEDRDWRIGLIVGPSGSGKSTLVRELFADAVMNEFAWPAHRSLVDGFPEHLRLDEITRLLARVGLGSPPSWRQPFDTLSTGERFRANLARALASDPERLVVDEFTSNLDRRVARYASSAIAKTIRERRTRLVAATCHDDVSAWLCPDWIVDMARLSFRWRSLRRRPAIELEIHRCDRGEWKRFAPHHYLSGTLNPSARCFLGVVEESAAAFCAVVHQPHPRRSGWREHRTVCLPDFQGVGIGTALSDMIASLYHATGKPFRSVTAHPALIDHRVRSNDWRLRRRASRTQQPKLASLARSWSGVRRTAAFEYVGAARPLEAKQLGIVRGEAKVVSR
ncbi:Zinc import ATP-binding protein ZnuC [Planctomycetes bacterium Pan216]|uniref:Zinc import ATP-binding protein ZnuC n=1 Tax=Kolteria novifilia TaxID=2527975 RepID=A0A518AZ62_9BACT|nr:Zinc import ATP-binding protein ZnuC [Planctomycetes bacterium Pan216]